MVSPRKRVLADRPRPARRQGTSKLGAVKLSAQSGTSSGMSAMYLLLEDSELSSTRAVATAASGACGVVEHGPDILSL